MTTLSPSERGGTIKQPRFDVHDLVTTTIVEQLERGIIPWEKPFLGLDNQAIPLNFTTGNKYRGINILLLWCAAMKRVHDTNQWATRKQWRKIGEAVREGEEKNGNLIVFYETYKKEIDGEVKDIPFLKASYVFNRSQLQGYVAPEVISQKQLSEVERIGVIDAFIANTKAIIEYHKGGAYYMPLEDKIMLPMLEHFIQTKSCTPTENFYATAFHELAHWTGSEKRLQRINHKKFGDKNYATEELVAELSAAFLCAGFGMPTAEKGNHAAYISTWLKALKENNRCIVTAASAANKAVEYLYSLQ